MNLSNENASFRFDIEYIAIETKTPENPGFNFSGIYANTKAKILFDELIEFGKGNLRKRTAKFYR